MKREQRFIKMVSRKMTKAGFECKMTDDQFIVIKDGKPFVVEIWDTPSLGRRRVHFSLNFIIEEMDTVMPEALMWLASESNNSSDYTTMRLLRNHFSCCVETSVRSPKEFVREFGFAYKQIAFAYKDLFTNYNRIKNDFREEPVRRPIGFMADRYMAELEKEKECKLAAQSYTTFAGKHKTKGI